MVITASVLAVAAGIGWIAYGEVDRSEAAYFEASISMVDYQTGKMAESLDETRQFVVEVEHISNIHRLIDDWAPRYRQARTAYRKFDAAISAAEERAEAYFAAQRALTDRFHSEELRIRAKAADDADFLLYGHWRARAHSVRGEALNMMNQLSDMDTELEKLKLTTEFSFDAEGFKEVPFDILALGDELAKFQMASENIREITASPFEPGR